MGVMEDITMNMETNMLDQLCEDDSSDEEIMKAKHRRSLVVLEQNLMVPCDDSPIAPETLKQREVSSDGASIERLLLERLLLRKELRLRTMQERLLEQETKIQQLEDRLSGVEKAPGFSTFLVLSGCCSRTMDSSQNLVNLCKHGLRWTFFIFYQMVLYLFDLVPSPVTLGLAAIVQRAGNLLAQRAENFSNERAERAELEKKKGHEARRRSSRSERRRR